MNADDASRVIYELGEQTAALTRIATALEKIAARGEAPTPRIEPSPEYTRWGAWGGSTRTIPKPTPR
jgi:hypothetical protein